MNTEILPPHNTEAEQAVLGAILIDPDALYEVGELLRPESFYRPAHGWLYEAIQTLHGRNEPLDIVAIEEELRRMGKLADFGGITYLFDLANAVPTSINAATYAEIVAGAATRRRLLTAAGKIAKAAYDTTVAVGDVQALAENELMAATSAATGSTVKAPRRYMSEYIDAFMADVIATESPRVVKTGLADVDAILGGLERQHQYIVAGATSMGKSSFALGLALDAALRQGKRVLIFSLEMSEEQLGNRLVSMLTGIPVERLKAASRRYLLAEEQARVMTASGQISDSRLYLDCSPGIKPSDVRSRAARVYAEHGLDMIIVDHLHIMRANNSRGDTVEDLGNIAMDLAHIYKQFDVAGVTLAQLNREVGKRAVKTPILSDLRESGRIEENAYCIMFLHRPAYYDPETENPNIAKVIVAKARDGRTGSADVYWNPALATFKDLAVREIELNPRPQRNGVYSR